MRTLILVTITTVALVGASANVAAASEDPYGADPYCDDNQWQGSGNFWPRVDNLPGIHACEGEHWEGADTTGGSAVSHQYSGQDGNHDDGPGLGGVGVRVNSAPGKAFTGVGIGGVGVANLYAEPQSSKGAVVALYIRDNTDETGVACLVPNFGQNTDCNVLAEVVHQTPVRSGSDVKEEGDGNPGPDGQIEGDCTQDATNEAQAYDQGTCSRDNTAITIQLGPQW